MRVKTLALLMLATLGLAAGHLPSAHAGVKAGDRAKELKGVVGKSGKDLRLSSLRGKVVVLTFGASWCKPCKKELPALDKIAIQLVRKERKNVRFLAINVDSEISTGKRFVAGLDLDCIISGFDPEGKAATAWAARIMPSVYLIDERGVVRHIHAGYKKGDEKALEKKIRELL